MVSLSTDLHAMEILQCTMWYEKRQLMGGYLYTSAIVFSIGATAGVPYREVVRWWEGPLWEGPLWEVPLHIMLHRSSSHAFEVLEINGCTQLLRVRLCHVKPTNKHIHGFRLNWLTTLGI